MTEHCDSRSIIGNDELRRYKAIEAAAKALLRSSRTDGDYLRKSSYEAAREQLVDALAPVDGEKNGDSHG